MTKINARIWVITAALSATLALGCGGEDTEPPGDVENTEPSANTNTAPPANVQELFYCEDLQCASTEYCFMHSSGAPIDLAPNASGVNECPEGTYEPSWGAGMCISGYYECLPQPAGCWGCDCITDLPYGLGAPEDEPACSCDDEDGAVWVTCHT